VPGGPRPEQSGWEEDASAAKFLDCAGGAQFARFQYRTALASYYEARKLAESSGDPRRIGGSSTQPFQPVSTGLGYAVRSAGPPNKAFHSPKNCPISTTNPSSSSNWVGFRTAPKQKPPGTISGRESRQRRKRGDPSVEAVGLDLLGQSLQSSGDLNGAELAFSAARRLRLTNIPSEIGFFVGAARESQICPSLGRAKCRKRSSAW